MADSVLTQDGAEVVAGVLAAAVATQVLDRLPLRLDHVEEGLRRLGCVALVRQEVELRHPRCLVDEVHGVACPTAAWCFHRALKVGADPFSWRR